MNICGIGVSGFDFFLYCHLFGGVNFHVLDIHDLVVNLVSDEKFLENMYPEQPMFSFWDSM